MSCDAGIVIGRDVKRISGHVNWFVVLIESVSCDVNRFVLFVLIK